MRERYQYRETIVTISADREEYIAAAKNAIHHHRRDLERYIRDDPFFQVTLDPYSYELPGDPPEIVGRMVSASNRIGLGPMSAVAGTIAWLAVEAMIERGAKYAVVDNGGDIALVSDRPLTIGLYAGESPIQNIGLRIPPTDRVLGICSSSGTVGPSISFGEADVATTFSHDVSLADSAATALGNAVEDTPEVDFEEILPDDIIGALVVKDDKIALWGRVPEIVRADLNPDLITRA